MPVSYTHLPGLPALRYLVVSGNPVPGQLHFRGLLESASPALETEATSPDDVAFWLYSSGSTGRPKGALHLHADLSQTAHLYGCLLYTSRCV